jgi:peptidoglycan/LPS O-acetylase OafA/YrhL
VPKVKSVWLATAAEVGSIVFLCAWLWGIAVWVTDVKAAHAARWNGIYIPPLLLLIWVVAHNGGLVSRALTWRPVAYLGDLSYAFYMIHWSVLLTFAITMHRFGGNKWGYGWKWAATGAASVLLTVLCYHLYEVPVREWLRRKLLIRRKPAVPVEGKPADAANSPQPGVLPFPAPQAGERAA